MKKLTLVLVSLILGTLMASAQDIITKRNGDEIRAVVTAVGPTPFHTDFMTKAQALSIP